MANNRPTLKGGPSNEPLLCLSISLETAVIRGRSRGEGRTQEAHHASLGANATRLHADPCGGGGLLYLQAGRINPTAEVALIFFLREPQKIVTHLENFDEQSGSGRFGGFDVELHLSLSLDHYDAINRDKDLPPKS